MAAHDLEAMAMARSAGNRASEALSLARDARTVAVEAKTEARSAVEGYRSVYVALGEITAEVSHIRRAFEALEAKVKRVELDSVRPPAPSADDIATVVAEKVVEQTGSHHIPSERVLTIVSHDRNARIAKAVFEVVKLVVAAVIGAAVSWAATHWR